MFLTYYGIPFSTESHQPTMGNWFQYQCDSSGTFCDCGLAFNEAAYASETIRAAILSKVNSGEIDGGT